MANRTVRATIVGIVGVLVLPVLVVAQQPASPGQSKSMDDMMQECQTHCQATTSSLDQLTKRMDEAKQSNDPAQMRAALDEAQKPLAEMKDHMRTCMHTMGMMQGMHGGMGSHMEGSHMKGMMQEKGAQSGAESR